jgi:hypothetical protein
MSNNFHQDSVQWREILNNPLKDTLSMNSEHVANQGAKIAVIWAAVGITTWQEAAGFLAFILSFLALCEWIWKKFARPILIWRGYMKPVKRRIIEEVEDE